MQYGLDNLEALEAELLPRFEYEYEPTNTQEKFDPSVQHPLRLAYREKAFPFIAA